MSNFAEGTLANLDLTGQPRLRRILRGRGPLRDMRVGMMEGRVRHRLGLGQGKIINWLRNVDWAKVGSIILKTLLAFLPLLLAL